jgi:hypothetical protein
MALLKHHDKWFAVSAEEVFEPEGPPPSWVGVPASQLNSPPNYRATKLVGVWREMGGSRFGVCPGEHNSEHNAINEAIAAVLALPSE